MLSNGLFLLPLILVDVSISDSLELVEHGDLVWDLESATRGEDSLAPASGTVCEQMSRASLCADMYERVAFIHVDHVSIIWHTRCCT